jgi:hypothetical protein
MLAPDVRVIAMTTAPYPPPADLTGAGEYTMGLVAFAGPVVPGSVRELASAGDERNALLTLDLRVAAAGSAERHLPVFPCLPSRRRQDQDRAGHFLRRPGVKLAGLPGPRPAGLGPPSAAGSARMRRRPARGGRSSRNWQDLSWWPPATEL